MQDRLAKNVTVVKLAAIAGVSKFHFIRLFSATTGLTPYQYMIRLRLRSAAQLLSTTGHPVTDIAKMCGYASAGQFAAAFRRQYGASPTVFRAQRPDQRLRPENDGRPCAARPPGQVAHGLLQTRAHPGRGDRALACYSETVLMRRGRHTR